MIGCAVCLSIETETHGAGSVVRCAGCGHAWSAAGNVDGFHPPAVPDALRFPLPAGMAAEEVVVLTPDENPVRPWERLPDVCGAADVGWLMVTVHEPRRLLREVRRRLSPGGQLRLLVPIDAADGSWRQNGELRCFSRLHVQRLVGTCGFAIREERLVRSGHRELMAMDAERLAEPSPPALVGHYLGTLTAGRRAVGRRIVAAAAEWRRVGVWGLGSDYAALEADEPEIRRLLAEGRLALFDRTQAGREVGGQVVEPPEAITTFPGPVFIVPSTRSVREAMRAMVRTLGWAGEGIVDAYGDA